MGVGGLLMEIVTRPQPRAEPPAAAAATHRRRRAGGRPLDPHGRTEQAPGRDRGTGRWCASRPRRRWPRAREPVIVVTGHQREEVETALAGLPVRLVHNPDFAEGLGTSLKAGIAAVPADADGAIVCLGDMPQVDAALIDRLIAAFDPERGALVVVPTFEGKRGNPVLWSRRFFPDLMAIEGDVGARHLIGRYSEAVAEVPVEGKAALVDVDTPEALLGVKAEIEARVHEMKDRRALGRGRRLCHGGSSRCAQPPGRTTGSCKPAPGCRARQPARCPELARRRTWTTLRAQPPEPRPAARQMPGGRKRRAGKPCLRANAAATASDACNVYGICGRLPSIGTTAHRTWRCGSATISAAKDCVYPRLGVRSPEG